jgi:hypothetical protein
LRQSVLTALLLLAALSLRGLIAPEQASARLGAPVADAAGSLGLPVTQSRHHRHRRDIPAPATMDTARHSSDF